MLFEPKCATASPAVPLPATVPFTSAVLISGALAARIVLSLISRTSTSNAQPIDQPLSS